ncbi:hypothetical protein B9P99_04505 [Candidatus Marsarchaeota G1 archaeon OSP_B]|uniref:Rieske domain-containing protein n=1 Tax=Candidatus Marsarchaeota G1 archaeon OSP_B TaxID=1978153 RepID=A0A2R6AWS1_9ARCH|nr:MAG: hypothetical protein B9P99_04505 [Candidatus Marsarchaeota G1 archaeon OSP_B]
MSKVIHCSCHGSTYDPYQGGKVVTGPTQYPLPAVVLQWDPTTDQLYATRMVGPVIYGHTSDLQGWFTAKWRHNSGGGRRKSVWIGGDV